MVDPVLSTIGVIGEGVKAAAAAIPFVAKIFESFKKQESGSMSVVLAVGYYYNFLDPVFGEIARGELELFASKADKAPRRFAPENVSVQIIVPSRLQVDAFLRCEAEYDALHKGQIYLQSNKRFFGINYELKELPAGDQLTIVDLAWPIMSVKRFYEDFLKQDTSDDSNEKWRKRQLAEIAAFKETVRGLQKRGYSGQVKLDFRDRG